MKCNVNVFHSISQARRNISRDEYFLSILPAAAAQRTARIVRYGVELFLQASANGSLSVYSRLSDA